jgi:Spy/CpxP family protein refolding chaperone
MTKRTHRLVLALALSGLCCGAWAQSGANDGSGADADYHHDAYGPAGMDGHGYRNQELDEHDGHQHHHCHHGWKHHGPQAWGHGERGEQGPLWGGLALLRDFHKLDLSEAQHAQLHGILVTAHEQLIKQHEHMGVQRPADTAALEALANPGDPNYANALQTAKKLATERIQQRSDFELKLYNVLTPAQKTQLTKLIAERQAERAEWAAHHERGEHDEHGDRDHGDHSPPMTH